MATNNEVAQQKSFNPSWMTASPLRQLSKPNGMHRVSNEDEENASHEICDPIFAKHRYGREDILALMPKDSKPPPDGLEKCPYYSEKPQLAIIMTNLNEHEQRLQQNINSSKALSAAHRNDWQGKEINDGSNSPQTNNPWTIAGSSRSGSAFRSNNRSVTSNNEGSRGSKAYPGFGRAGFNQSTGNNGSERQQRSTRAPWSDYNNASKGRQHLKSIGDDSTIRADDTEQTKISNTDAPWASTWRSNEDKHGWRPAETKGATWRETKNNENKPKTTDNSTRPFNRTNSNDNSKNDVQTKENIWSSSLHNNTVWSPPSLDEISAETEKFSNIIGHSESDFSAQPKESLEPKPDEWFYLDPQKNVQGPFSHDQMNAWFVSGYFNADLQIMQPGGSTYTALADLIKQNGTLTPFTKPKSPSPPIQSNTKWTRDIQKPQSEIPSNFAAKTEVDLQALKLLEIKERMIAEKEAKLRAEEKEREEVKKNLLELQQKLEQQRLEIEQQSKLQERQLELQKIKILEFEREQREKLDAELAKRRQQEQEKAEQERIRQRLQIEAELKAKEEQRRLIEYQQQQQEIERQKREQDWRLQQEELAKRRQVELELEMQRKANIATKAAPWAVSQQMSTQFIEIQKQEQMAEAIRRKKLEEELKAGQKKVAVQSSSSNPWNVVKPQNPIFLRFDDVKPSAPKPAAKVAKTSPPAKEPKAQDPLVVWIVQKIRQMNTDIDDPDVFASFLQGIESPNEVEDYIVTYFGENKRAKEFHQEFLTKRIELRPRNRGGKKDDLSAPAIAADSIPTTSLPNGKKSKKGKKIDISAAMNFKPTGGERFNVGEIDTELPAATKKKGKKK